MFRNIRHLTSMRSLVIPSSRFLNSALVKYNVNAFQNQLPISRYIHSSTSLLSKQHEANSDLTKGEKELVVMLTEEIVNERKLRSSNEPLPTKLEDFQIKTNNAEVTLTKELDFEKITVSFNINHTVGTDFNEDESDASDEEFNELKSLPNFKIEIAHDETILSFLCSFTPSNVDDPQYTDKFAIDEISIYEKEWNDKVYSVSGEIIDKYMYDLLMNYLDEKGISNKFADLLCEFSSDYEHELYVQFLEKMSKFTSKH